MRYNKEVIYHFSCEKCENWWSYPSSEDLVDFWDPKMQTWVCPHCGLEHKPPHIDKDDVPSIASEDFMKTLRKGL